VKAAWYRSEARDVRPFFEVQSIEGALSHASIRLYENIPYTEESSFVINEQDVGRLDISIRPSIDRQLIESCPKAVRDELTLVVRATNPFLKRTQVVTRCPVLSVPQEITIGSEVLEKLGGGTNLDLDSFVCLDAELPKKAGRPFFPGHWLAKKGFKLRSARVAEDFDIEPLDDAGWTQRGYPPKTLYLVQYIGPMNEKTLPEQQIAKVFVHVDVYRRIAAETNPKNVRAIQAILAAEIVCQILAASISMSEWEDATAPEAGSPLSAVLKRINKTFKCDLASLRALAREPGLQKLRAVLQADQDVVRAIVEG